MPATARRYTVATVLDRVLIIDRKHTEAETVYTLDDFAAVADVALMVRHLEGKPFHMAADLLGIAPGLLFGCLISGAELDGAISDQADGGDKVEPALDAAALRAAAAMYQAETAPAAPVPGPDMRNDALADLLDGLDLTGFDDTQRAAIEEAAQRIRERRDEEEA